MSERNSMQNIFDQIRNHQVEAPLSVMEGAIQKVHQRKRRKIMLGWTAMVLFTVAIVLGIWPKSSEIRQPQIQPATPSKEKTEPVVVPEINPSAKTSVSIVKQKPLLKQTKVVGGSQDVSNEKIESDNVMFSEESVDIPMPEKEQVQDSMQRSNYPNDVPTQPNPTVGSKNKQSKPGTRKLKLIVPKP